MLLESFIKRIEGRLNITEMCLESIQKEDKKFGEIQEEDFEVLTRLVGIRLLVQMTYLFL